MWSLPKPTITARQSFTQCISSVADATDFTRLSSATPAIESAALIYEAAAQAASLHTVPRVTTINGNVTADEMKRIYKYRMVNKKHPGRAVYDQILLSADNGLCPLCGQRTVSTLDHVLPQAHYPDLTVTPENLVPACKDCNKAKLSSYPTTASDAPLHPYFDHIEHDRWLYATVIQTRPASLLFRLNAPSRWSATLTSRAQNHFTTLGLSSLYGSQAASYLRATKTYLIQLHKTGGGTLVKEYLESRALSGRTGSLNSWLTASYEAWAADPWFYNGGFI